MKHLKFWLLAFPYTMRVLVPCALIGFAGAAMLLGARAGYEIGMGWLEDLGDFANRYDGRNE